MAGEQATAAARRILEVMPDWGHAISQINALIADRMGVTLSDLDCLDALNKHGPATASTLARFVDLTSGSVSRMVDRLDAAGCITRIKDPHDRRKVLIEPTADGLARLRSYYAGLAACTLDDLAEFTEAELAAVQRFIDKARDSTTAELNRLRGAPTTLAGKPATHADDTAS